MPEQPHGKKGASDLHRAVGAVAAAVPLLGTLRHYSGMAARRDALAGLGVAAILVPQGMAYGQLAGLKPVVGLYSALGAMVGFALFSRSRQLIVGPEAALAALTAITVGELAHGDAARALALSGALALIIGVLLVVAGLIRVGFLAEFLSRPVLLGYIMGVALTVIASQLPKLFGFKPKGENFFTISWHIITHLGMTSVTTLSLGLGLLALSFGLQRFAPRLPSALLVIVLATAVSAIFDLSAHGVVVTGKVPAGLPHFGLPDISGGDVRTLAAGGAAMALLAFADSIATARSFAVKHGEDVDANRESLALGVANIGAALTSGFPSGASGSRTAVNDGARVRCQLSQLLAAAAIVLVLLFLTPLLTDLPLAALAAVVIAATVRLFDFPALLELWRLWQSEALLAVITLLAVAILDVLTGLAIAVTLAIINLLYRTTSPHDAVLAVQPGQKVFRDITNLDEPMLVDELIIYRFDAPLFFANASMFRQRVLGLVRREGGPVRGVLVDAGAIFYVDSTAIAMLQQLRDDLHERGVWLGAARMTAPVREMIERAGRQVPVDRELQFHTVAEAVDWFAEDEHGPPLRPASAAARGGIDAADDPST